MLEFLIYSPLRGAFCHIIIHMQGDHAKYDLDQAKIFLHIRRGLRHKIEQFWLENFPRSLQSDLFLFNRTYATPTFEWTAFHFVTSRATRAATERSICEGKYQERSICEGKYQEKYRFAGYQLDCLCPSCCAWINMLLSSHSKCNIWYIMDNK